MSLFNKTKCKCWQANFNWNIKHHKIEMKAEEGKEKQQNVATAELQFT